MVRWMLNYDDIVCLLYMVVSSVNGQRQVCWGSLNLWNLIVGMVRPDYCMGRLQGFGLGVRKLQLIVGSGFVTVLRGLI